MATIRERRPGVWEVRVFAGRDTSGRPVQTSRTVRGTKRDAMRLAASFDSRPATHAAGRTVADILNAWVEVNQEVWAESSRRDQEGRVRKVLADPIALVPLSRLGVADVEQWHARMRRAEVGELSIRNRHGVLRAALAQAVRWEWIGTNPAAAARLRQPKRVPRDGMSIEAVRAAIAAAREIDPAAGLALRLAAVAGLRRAELAALRWEDLEGHQLTVDKAVELVPDRAARPPRASPGGDEDGQPAADRPGPPDGGGVRSAARRAGGGLAVPVLARARPAQSGPHRLVVDPGPPGGRDRPEVAPPRPPALDRHRRHQQRT